MREDSVVDEVDISVVAVASRATATEAVAVAARAAVVEAGSSVPTMRARHRGQNTSAVCIVNISSEDEQVWYRTFTTVADTVPLYNTNINNRKHLSLPGLHPMKTC